ncbi:MlaE family lipid ABC transporter permease subunit [Marinilabiliaceae bacterium ANBcel2]|nr:MlaE family lipid ABC transporter permease subunit [Marinilabiliaceae bacterium ANBcel2]
MEENSPKNSNFSFNQNVLFIKDRLEIDNAAKLVREALKRLSSKNRPNHLIIDLSQLKDADSAGITSIFYLKKEYEKCNITTEIKYASKKISEKLELFKPSNYQHIEKNKTFNLFYLFGEKAYKFLSEEIVSFFLLIANISFWSFTDLFKKKQRRKGETVNQAVAIGVNAVPIIVALSFIIGLVLALQSASQLRNFGADIFIVDLVVIAMMAEMGPLITAILVAGRSGSAIAAEIATMKVTSETDALKTMGINPLRFVVIPKVYGGVMTMPFLAMIANVCGIAGGAVAAWAYLDITPAMFITRMSESIYQKDILTGVIKSIVFIITIVITGTYFGLRVKEGARGVGIATTQSVVAAISLVIIADSILGLIFY